MYKFSNLSEQRKMNTYHIKIDGMFFVGTSDKEIAYAPVGVGGWYDEGAEVKGIVLSRDKDQAKLIEGAINLKSHWNRIYDAIRYGDFKFNKIEIVRVDDDSRTVGRNKKECIDKRV